MTREMFMVIQYTEDEKKELIAAFDTIKKVKEQCHLAKKEKERNTLEDTCNILMRVINGETI